MALDPIDQKLLAELRENARYPTALLARKVGLSRTAVQARIARLERDNVIKGYTLRTGDQFERSLVRAHVMLKLGSKLAGNVEAAVRRIPEVRSLYSVSGAFDMIAIVHAESVERLDALIDVLGQLDGVERTNTSVLLSTRIDR